MFYVEYYDNTGSFRCSSPFSSYELALAYAKGLEFDYTITN